MKGEMEKDEGMETLCDGETVHECLRVQMLREAVRSREWKVEGKYVWFSPWLVCLLM